MSFAHEIQFVFFYSTERKKNCSLQICHKFIKNGGVRACLHGDGGTQVGEVTRLGGVKQYAAPLHAMLQPRHPRVHYLLLNGR